MKEAIGSVPLYNFIIIFIVITFAFISATLMYYRAFKLNSSVEYALEEFEGLNSESIKEINRSLGSFGYNVTGSVECTKKNNMEIQPTDGINYPICIYESELKDGYFIYGVTTYISLDLPVINQNIMIPVYSESERIFKFSK